jgi:uncharacterized protein involved in exopolysaccharide biosynthesis
MRESADATKQDRTLRDLIETICRHRKKAFAFFVAVLFGAVIMLAFLPPSYSSSSKLLLRRGRESVFPDPAAAAGETSLPLYKEWESELNSELEVLNSRELVVQVIKALGPDVFLKDVPADETGRLGPVRRAFDPVRRFLKDRLLSAKKEKDREQKQNDSLIELVEKNLEIRVLKKSDVITVTYTANRPELARKVVDELIKLYLDRRMELYRIPGAEQFFNQQMELLLNEIQDNEKQIFAIKEKNGTIGLDSDSSALQTMVEKLRADQLGVQARLAAAKARVQTLRRVLSNEAVGERSDILNPVEYKELQADLRREESSLAALTAENEEISGQLERLQSELLTIKEQEASIRRLQREQILLEEKYRRYSENREQVRINQELETRKISNVTIIQQATFPSQPKPSGKLTKLIAALFLGLAGALAITFVADYLDPRLHSAATVRERIQQRVLAELPRIKGRELDPAWVPAVPGGRRGFEILHASTSAGGINCDEFQTLYLRLLSLRSPDTRGALVIGLTGSTGGEGVSTVAGKLASAFSRDGRFRDVLLLDVNPVEHSSQMVKQRTDLPFALREIRAEDDVVEASTAIQHLKKAGQENHDVIIVDIPPINKGSYGIRVSIEADLIALVVDCDQTSWRCVKRSVDMLEHAGSGLCGVILNRQQRATPGWLYSRL